MPARESATASPKSKTGSRSAHKTKEGMQTINGNLPALNGHAIKKHGVHPNGRSSALLMKSDDRPESSMTAMEKMQLTQEGISKKQLEQLKERAALDYDQLS